MVKTVRSEKRLAILPFILINVLSVSASHATDLATVNNRVFTERDLRSALGGLNNTQQERFLADRNNKREVLNNIIDEEVLTGEAFREKLDQEPDFKLALETFKRNYLSNRVLEQNLKPRLTETAAQKYYESNKRKYSTELAQVQHILLTDEASARNLISKAKAPNADFQELAEKYSQDPSAKNNRGEIGFIGHRQFTEEFTNAAFGASIGEVVGPVKTKFGYHIIKLVKKISGKPLSYEEVELRVKNDLRDELRKRYISNLRKQASIRVDDRALDRM